MQVQLFKLRLAIYIKSCVSVDKPPQLLQLLMAGFGGLASVMAFVSLAYKEKNFLQISQQLRISLESLTKLLKRNNTP